jgi:hypothetical protein
LSKEPALIPCKISWALLTLKRRLKKGGYLTSGSAEREIENTRIRAISLYIKMCGIVKQCVVFIEEFSYGKQ